MEHKKKNLKIMRRGAFIGVVFGSFDFACQAYALEQKQMCQNSVLKTFLTFCLVVCNMCVYLHHTIMRRFNFFIEQKWIDRIKRDMKKHGFTSVSSFIRHIIIKFFEQKS